MKLHFNLSHPSYFGNQISKTIDYYTQEAKITNQAEKISLKKVKSDLNKLKPNHW